MPKWLLQKKEVSLGAKTLYAVMASCAYDGSDNCWPSQGYLAESMGVSVRSVQNYLRELEGLGLILSKRGRFGSSLKYFFLKAAMVELRTASTGRIGAACSRDTHDGQMSQGCAKLSPVEETPAYAKPASGYAKSAHIKNLISFSKDNSPLPPKEPLPGHGSTPQGRFGGGGYSSALKSADEAFERMFTLWPRKEAKLAALKVWRKAWFAGTLPPVETLLERVRYLIRTDRAWLRGYPPYLRTWLLEERWRDMDATRPTVSSTPCGQESPKPEAIAAFSQEESEAMLAVFRDRARRENALMLQERRVS